MESSVKSQVCSCDEGDFAPEGSEWVSREEHNKIIHECELWYRMWLKECMKRRRKK